MRAPAPSAGARSCTVAAMSTERFTTLLAAARDGSEAAWQELYNGIAPVVLGYLRANGSPDPEDVLSEVFLQVARDIATFDGDERGFRSWVFTIAHHRLIDARRHAADGRSSSPPSRRNRAIAPMTRLTKRSPGSGPRRSAACSRRCPRSALGPASPRDRGYEHR